MSETNDQPAAEAGVGGQGEAPNDDLNTELYDRVEVTDEDDDTDPGEAGEGGDENHGGTTEGGDDDPDIEEVELEGAKYRIPKAVKPLLMMQQDYTRKTQELGEHRRAFEAERTDWQAQREQSLAELPQEHARVAVLEHNISALKEQIEGFAGIDWDGWAHRVGTADPSDPEAQKDRATFKQYSDAWLASRNKLAALEDEHNAAKADLKTKEDQRLQSQREAAAAALAKAQEETGRVLAEKIEGWSPEKCEATLVHAYQAYGVSPQEMAVVTDARVWTALHDNMRQAARIAELETALKQKTTERRNAKDQEVQPAARPRGGGGTARDPATSRGDDLSTKEWMRRRNAQTAKA